MMDDAIVNPTSDIRIFDSVWLQDHPDVVRTWSPFQVLWAISHDLLILTAPSCYQLVRAYGFANPAQAHAYTALIAEYQNIQRARQVFQDVYRVHRVAGRAYGMLVERDAAYVAAETCIVVLYRDLSVSVPALCCISTALARGQYGYMHEHQAQLFQIFATSNTRLLQLVQFLGIWRAACVDEH